MIIFLLFTILSLSYAYPTNNDLDDETANAEMAYEYLERFGLWKRPEDDPFVRELRTQEDLKKALKQYQWSAAIPETGLIDEATMGRMKQKQCGNTQALAARRGGEPAKWSKNRITYRIGNFEAAIPPPVIKLAIREAFDYWTKVVPLTFVEVDGKADINIRFERGRHDDGPGAVPGPFDGKGQTLAHAFFPELGVLHFDSDEDWTYKDVDLLKQDYTDILSTAVHEIGHAIGLDHINDPKSIMFPYLVSSLNRGKYIQPVLSSRDIKAVQSLYGQPRNEKPTPPPRDPTRGPRNNPKCPSKVDAFAGEPGRLGLIFDDEKIYAIDGNRIVKTFALPDLFPGLKSSKNLVAAFDTSRQQFLIINKSKSKQQYSYYNFNPSTQNYMKDRKAIHPFMGTSTKVTGVMLNKNIGSLIYLNGSNELFYESESSPESPDDFIEFMNFPKGIKGGIFDENSQSLLFSKDSVYLFDAENDRILFKKSLQQYLNC